ncbi:MAG: hypothetical protein J4428_01245 [Candidatus Aenigmarchaeota archaeon]|nr:hypothetical protein [Candidatus Aenigmarchaeota archaeon]
MSSISVHCAYCGQIAKSEHCGFYRGMNIHNMITCNCLKEAIKIESTEEFNKKKWFV